MPLLQLKLSGVTTTAGQQAALQLGLTRLMADLLGKRADLTVVSIDQAPAERWSVAGVALPSAGWGASLVVHLTEGTNTPDEQAVFIEAAHELIRSALPGTPAAPVYVIVNEVPASAWGYDGQTQSARRPKVVSPALRPQTLRELAGVCGDVQFDAGNTALLLIDFQREYAADGRLPLSGLGAAAAQAQRLADVFDQHGALVVHIHHAARTEKGVPFAVAEGGVIALDVPAVRPRHRVIRKALPSAFHDTGLQEHLQAAGIRQLVIAGAMTHNCVDSSARAALHLGYQVHVVADACATRDLPGIDGNIVPAGRLHRTALAALADRHAQVVSTREVALAWNSQAGRTGQQIAA